MRHSIAVKVTSLLAEDGFSLDELVIRTKELFEQEGIVGFLSLLLDLLDVHLCTGLTRRVGVWQPRPCCPEPTYTLDRRVPRRVRTSVGTVRICWRRLRCLQCGHSFLPLREFLNLARYQSKSAELEQIVTEVVSEQNYRRTAQHLARIGLIPVPKSTAHRWVATSDCSELSSKGKAIQDLLADGTGFKRRPDTEQGITNKGEVRIALGVRPDGKVEPLGAWSGISWDEIGQALAAGRPKDQDRPLAVTLVSDGEPGLARGLADLANDQQRCQWHGVHQMGYFMWRDQAPRAERKAARKTLQGILGIELPAGDFQTVSAADKAALEATTQVSERQLDELVRQLQSKGYSQAATYVRQAKDKLFTYIHLWLKCGLVSMRVTSIMERMMREIGRRLKRIAFGWSEAGAARMARIIIKRFTSAHEWVTYWQKRLRIDGRVTLVFDGAQTT